MTLPGANVPTETPSGRPDSATPSSPLLTSPLAGNGAADGTGVLRAAPTRVPRPQGWSRQRKALVAGGVLLGVTALVSAFFLIGKPFQKERTDLVLHKVAYGRMELTIVERGNLESAKNSDIYCRVKAGNKGSTVASQIKMVIDDGSEVLQNRPLSAVRTVHYFDAPTATWQSRPGKAGPDGATVVEVDGPQAGEKQYSDLLVDLDDSGLQEQLKTQKITVDKAESDKIQAEEAYKITVSQNDSDIKTAETKLELAIIDLMKYTGLDLSLIHI